MAIRLDFVKANQIRLGTHCSPRAQPAQSLAPPLQFRACAAQSPPAPASPAIRQKSKFTRSLERTGSSQTSSVVNGSVGSKCFWTSPIQIVIIFTGPDPDLDPDPSTIQQK
jgi:hypothetical protein